MSSSSHNLVFSSCSARILLSYEYEYASCQLFNAPLLRLKLFSMLRSSIYSVFALFLISNSSIRALLSLLPTKFSLSMLTVRIFDLLDLYSGIPKSF